VLELQRLDLGLGSSQKLWSLSVVVIGHISHSYHGFRSYLELFKRISSLKRIYLVPRAPFFSLL
jgi:hypothetical protein